MGRTRGRPVWARAVDANQALLVQQLRDRKVKVRVLSGAGDGIPDLLVGYRRRFFLFEVKDGTQPPAARALTSAEQDFFDEFKGFPCFVVEGLDDALAAIGWRP